MSGPANVGWALQRHGRLGGAGPQARLELEGERLTLHEDGRSRVFEIRIETVRFGRWGYPTTGPMGSILYLSDDRGTVTIAGSGHRLADDRLYVEPQRMDAEFFPPLEVFTPLAERVVAILARQRPPRPDGGYRAAASTTVRPDRFELASPFALPLGLAVVFAVPLIGLGAMGLVESGGASGAWLAGGFVVVSVVLALGLALLYLGSRPAELRVSRGTLRVVSHTGKRLRAISLSEVVLQRRHFVVRMRASTSVMPALTLTGPAGVLLSIGAWTVAREHDGEPVATPAYIVGAADWDALVEALHREQAESRSEGAAPAPSG